MARRCFDFSWDDAGTSGFDRAGPGLETWMAYDTRDEGTAGAVFAWRISCDDDVGIHSRMGLMLYQGGML